MVLVHKDQDEKQLVLDITARVDGRQVPVEDLTSLTDLEKIKKVSNFVSRPSLNVSLWPAVRFLFSQNQFYFKR